jgi:Stage II sporulation protein E (SpoIIE)
MAPYLNGEPLGIEGALPLGMIEGAESSVMHFQLKPGDRLMLMSDGIAEATDAEGHLFGFERVHELYHRRRGACFAPLEPNWKRTPLYGVRPVNS